MSSATVNEELLERHGTLSALSGTEIIIEAWSDKCDRPLFNPLMAILRGRWDLTKFPGESMHEAVSRMPGPIPGIRLGVDPVNRTCRLFDPLDTEEYAELWRSLVRHYDDYSAFLTKGKKWPQNLQEDCTPSTIKTWLFWMRRLVDSKMAKASQEGGRLPKIAEIAKLPGKTQIGQGNSMIAYPLFIEDLNEFGMLKREIIAQGFVNRSETEGVAAPPVVPMAAVPQQMTEKQLVDELRAMGYEIRKPGDGDQDGGTTGPSGGGNSQGGNGGNPGNPAGPPRKGK